MIFYPSKLYLIRKLYTQYRQVSSLKTYENKTSSTHFTPLRKESKQTAAHKQHPSTLVRSMPMLLLSLLRSGFHNVPSYRFLAMQARYFSKLKTNLSFLTPFPCPSTVPKATLQTDSFLHVYAPGTRSLLSITVAELLAPIRYKAIAFTVLVHT